MFLNADDFLNYSIDKESEKLIDHYVYYYDEIKTQKLKQPKVKDNFLELQKQQMQRKTFNIQKRGKSSHTTRNKLSQSFDENTATFYQNKQNKLSLFNIAEEKALLSELSEENLNIQNQNRNHQIQQNLSFKKVKRNRKADSIASKRYQHLQPDQSNTQSYQNVSDKKNSAFTTVQSLNTSSLMNQSSNGNAVIQRKFPSIKRPSELDNTKDFHTTVTSSTAAKGFRILNNKPNNINPNFLSPKSEKLYGIYTNSTNVFTMKTMSTQSDVKTVAPKKQKQQTYQSPVKAPTERVSSTSMSRQRQYSLVDNHPNSAQVSAEKPKSKKQERCKSSQATQASIVSSMPTQNDEETIKKRRGSQLKNGVYKSIDLTYDKLRYQQVCNRLSLRIATIPQDFSERDELFLKDLLTDLRMYNPIFAKMQYFTGMYLLTIGKMYQINKKSIYTEKQQGVSFYIIIYGRVTLKTKDEGVFKECIMGESLGEDYYITKKEDKRQETARATEETCVLEFTEKDWEALKAKCFKEHLRDDYTKLQSLIRRSYLSKKSSKQNVAIKIEAPQMVY